MYICSALILLGAPAERAAALQGSPPLQEQGRPFVETIPAQTYGAHPQNFEIVAGARGRIYVANARGVLVHDGTRWTLVELPGQTPARSLARADDGTIYVGGQETLGRLEQTANGAFRYVPLVDEIPDAHRDFTHVWKTHAVGDAVYFGTPEALFRWKDGTMRAWEGPFHLALAARDTLYAQRPSGQLLRMAGDTLEPVAEAGTLPLLYFVVRHRSDGLIMGTTEGTLLHWTDGSAEPWSHERSAALQRSRIYMAQRLPNGLAIGTQAGGLFLYNDDGTLRQRIDQRSGLNDNYVYGVTRDRRGGLWLAQGRGLARVATHQPMTRYGDAEGLSGNVLDVQRTGRRLYVGTMDGLFALQPAETPGRPARFERVSSVPVVHDLLPVGSDLLAATIQGVLRVDAATGRVQGFLDSPHPDASSLALHRPESATAGPRLYVGSEEGIALFERVENEQTGNEWRLRNTLRPLNQRIVNLTLDAEGALWAASESGPMQRLVFPDSAETTAVTPTVAAYDTSDGLPSMRFNTPYRVGDRMVAGTADGPYRFDAEADRFVRDTTLRAPIPDPDRYVGPIASQPAQTGPNRIWMHVGETRTPTTGWLQRDAEGDDYTWHTGALQRLVGFTTYAISHDRTATWIGGPGLGPETLLVRYAPSAVTTRSRSEDASPEGPPVLLHRATLTDRDSTIALVASGTATSTAPTDSASSASPPVLAAADNSLRLSYASPAYDRPSETVFRVRITRNENEDAASWSPWRKATESTFTNLDPGDYVVAVQAKNVYGERGPVATAAFRVRPPWYRTWWAYGLWMLLGLGLIGGAVQWRTRRLRARQAELEATVADRTTAIRAKNEQLARQAEDLKALDQAKSRFFANLSHEFRTPLTLILGPVRKLKTAFRSAEQALDPDNAAQQLSMVERNAFRLLRMVRQMLDLAREDAGTLQLRARPVDVVRCTRRITRSFVPLAEREGLALTVEAPNPDAHAEAAPVYLDEELYKQMLGNLLSNAVKFTPEGGRITVCVASTPEAVDLRVSDTGPGIPEAMQEQIFERFVQADASPTRAHEGIGIGLALTHTLVDLHGGTLQVAESSAEGTTFAARFPRGRDHLTDEQVVASSPSEDASDWGSDDEALTPGAIAEDDVMLNVRPSTGDSQDAASHPPKRPLVLIVDDNADVRAYVRSVLEPTFRVAEAANGAAGLRMARKRLPDVILADVMMPEMDGLAMTERLRAHPETAAVPIIMLTARASTDDEVEGLAAGATDYIVKPFDAQVVQMRVRGALDYQQRLRKRLLAEAHSGITATDDSGDTPPADFVAEAEAIIQRRLPDPDFGIEALAEALDIGRTTLYRRANDHDLPAPGAWIRMRRLERAAELLAQDAGTVSEVAYAVGFQNLAHFSEQFLDHMGQRPSVYAEADA